jgi:hypothetical protein
VSAPKKVFYILVLLESAPRLDDFIKSMKESSMFVRIIFIFALLTLVNACSHFVPFTPELRKQYGLSDADVKNLQFYVSQKITLQHEMASGEKGITPGHSLRSVNNRQVEEVIVERKTPGIVEKSDWQTLSVSFEEGARLQFSVKNNNAVNYYCLSANKWVGNNGKLSYGTKEYMAVGQSSSACLLIPFDSLNKLKKDSRSVKGRKLD